MRRCSHAAPSPLPATPIPTGIVHRAYVDVRAGVHRHALLHPHGRLVAGVHIHGLVHVDVYIYVYVYGRRVGVRDIGVRIVSVRGGIYIGRRVCRCKSLCVGVRVHVHVHVRRVRISIRVHVSSCVRISSVVHVGGRVCVCRIRVRGSIHSRVRRVHVSRVYVTSPFSTCVIRLLHCLHRLGIIRVVRVICVICFHYLRHLAIVRVVCVCLCHCGIAIVHAIDTVVHIVDNRVIVNDGRFWLGSEV